MFSATAGPLLPDNMAFQSFNKMWKPPSNDSLDLPMETTQDSPKVLLQNTLRKLSVQHEPPILFNPFSSMARRTKSYSVDYGNPLSDRSFLQAEK